jgi:hypothetical protein
VPHLPLVEVEQGGRRCRRSESLPERAGMMARAQERHGF